MKHLLKISATALLIASSLSFATPVLAQQDCPPGLAKKNPPCVPPGQARQGVTTSEWLARNAIGDRISREDMMLLELLYPERYQQLPRLPEDEAYAVVDGGIVTLSRTSLQILRLIDIFAN